MYDAMKPVVYRCGIDRSNTPIVALAPGSLTATDPQAAKDAIDSFIKTVDPLTQHGYGVLLFVGGIKKNPIPISLLRTTYSQLEHRFRKALKVLYVVHSSVMYRVVSAVIGPMVSPKFWKKLVFVQSLSGLRTHFVYDSETIPRYAIRHDIRLTSDGLIDPQHLSLSQTVSDTEKSICTPVEVWHQKKATWCKRECLVRGSEIRVRPIGSVSVCPVIRLLRESTVAPCSDLGSHGTALTVSRKVPPIKFRSASAVDAQSLRRAIETSIPIGRLFRRDIVDLVAQQHDSFDQLPLPVSLPADAADNGGNGGREGCATATDRMLNIFQTEHDLRGAADNGLRILPPPIAVALQIIQERGLKTEGIYRLSASKDELDRLLDFVDDVSDSEAVVAVSDIQDIHLASGLIKTFLRLLPTPLIPYSAYRAFLAAAEHDSIADRYTAALTAVAVLPPPNRSILYSLIEHFRDVAASHSENKMSAKNLAVVLAPNILRLPTDQLSPSEALRNSSLEVNVIEALILGGKET
eukprot:Rmarinus@m.21589